MPNPRLKPDGVPGPGVRPDGLPRPDMKPDGAIRPDVKPDGEPLDAEDCSEESAAHAARFLSAVKALATTPKSAFDKAENARKSDQ